LIRNYSVYGWLQAITLKSFTFPCGIQLAPDLFGVAARVKSLAVQGHLAFGCTACSGEVCKGTCKLSRFHFEIN
jgi:hypothetical protein